MDHRGAGGAAAVPRRPRASPGGYPTLQLPRLERLHTMHTSQCASSLFRVLLLASECQGHGLGGIPESECFTQSQQAAVTAE